MKRLFTKLNTVQLTPLTFGEISDIYGTLITYNNKVNNGMDKGKNESISDISNNFIYKFDNTLEGNESITLEASELIIGSASGTNKGLFIIEKITGTSGNQYTLARSISYEDLISSLIESEYTLFNRNLVYLNQTGDDKTIPENTRIFNDGGSLATGK